MQDINKITTNDLQQQTICKTLLINIYIKDMAHNIIIKNGIYVREIINKNRL